MTETTPRYAARERAVLTPTQLNKLARSLLEDAFAQIWVEGEISNYTRASSGHWYFTLKDRDAQIRCAMFKSNNQYVRAKPADGVQVLVRGRISLYEARGDYQLICEHLEDAGAGRQMRDFEVLKLKLQAEGLTDPKRKRALPAWPGRIAAITSPQGAAIRDVLSVCARRWPLLQIDVYPTQVQGAEAAAQIRAALTLAIAAQPAYDLILLTRGGGSLEDLWPFNDEALARLIAASPVPTLSAVGHEVDVSIADLVADVRAATPSAAAELLAPDGAAVAQRLRLRADALSRRLRQLLHQRQQATDLCERLLRAHDPRKLIGPARRDLRSLQQDQWLRWQDSLRERRRVLTAWQERLRAQSPQQRIARSLRVAALLYERIRSLAMQVQRPHQERLTQLSQRLLHARIDIDRWRVRLQSTAHALRLLGPQATLERGYVLLRRDDGTLLTRAVAARTGEWLEAEFADGRIRVQTDASAFSTDGADR